MATRFQISFDCADPERLVPFWAAALGYVVQPAPRGYPTWREYWRSIGVPEQELGEGDCNDSIVDPDGVGPRVLFQPVPEGKVIKNRVHLDLGVSGGTEVPLPVRVRRVDAEVERLVELGASRLRVLSEPGVEHYGVVMQDPEGNEFCIH